MENEVMTVQEAADFLRISPGRVREYIWQRKLPAFQLVPGGAIRIHRQVLMEFLQSVKQHGLQVE